MLGARCYAALVAACAVAATEPPPAEPSLWRFHRRVEGVAFEPSKSLDALLQLPLRYYELKYDTVNSRQHFGPLADDAQRILGGLYNESIARVETRQKAAVAAARVSQPVDASGAVKAGHDDEQQVPIIDTSALFMHGVAAIQALAEEHFARAAIVAALSLIHI